MRTPIYELQDILKAFQSKKVLTKKELLSSAGCSSMTAWRLLSPHGYYTSYNNNACYYTLAGIPKFDENGLWTYGKAKFSKWGPLTKTIIGLTEESMSGLTAEQLEGLLKLKNVKPHLTQLIHNNSLTREKLRRSFVYFPRGGADGRKQKRQRKQELEQAAEALPSLEKTIVLLVEIIKNPKDKLQQWERRLGRRKIRISTSEIQAVLDHYKIDPKKGALKS